MGVADAPADLGVLRLQLRFLASEVRLFSIESPLVDVEYLTVDGVGVVGREQLGLVRLNRLGLAGDRLEAFVVDARCRWSLVSTIRSMRSRWPGFNSMIR